MFARSESDRARWAGCPAAASGPGQPGRARAAVTAREASADFPAGALRGAAAPAACRRGAARLRALCLGGRAAAAAPATAGVPPTEVKVAAVRRADWAA